MNSGPSFGIVSFNIEGFRGIKHASVEGIPADTKWIFLTGKNGGGKTSVLQALFVGIFGNQDGKFNLETQDFNIQVTVKALKGGELLFSQKVSNSYDRLFPYPNLSLATNLNLGHWWNRTRPIIAYGANRTQIQIGSISNNEASEISLKSRSLFERTGYLLNIESELKNWIYRSSSEKVKSRNLELAQKLESREIKTKELLLKLMPNCDSIELDVFKDKVLYFEKDDQGLIVEEPKTFEQLASGNRSIIAMIGDMVIRLLEGQPEISDPSDLEGIVLIDELDVHLHPSWQKALPGLLSDIFPKIQFIASTHSPIPLLGAPKETVVLKVHQSSQEGITVEKLDIDVTQLLPNSLLTSPIFDFEDIIPTANNNLEDLHTEDNFQEAMANEGIKNRLKKIAQTL